MTLKNNVVAILFSLTSNFVYSSSNFQLSFMVVDDENNGLKNAEILIEKQLNYSDSLGFVKFTFTNPGLYKYSINRIGYKSVNGEVKLSKSIQNIKVVMESVLFEKTAYVVKSVRVKQFAPFQQITITNADIDKQNYGQDIPMLLQYLPSVVSTSDAGNGVGYTGLRIRGSDATRINVTVNGIPINDAESHGVYWVNMPDLASSSQSIQIQRGIGSSTNGYGAFGGSISVLNTVIDTGYNLKLSQSYGSFNTLKSTLIFNTKINQGLQISGRLSKVKSDGYMDRAFSDLGSFQSNINYSKKKTFLQFVAFGGKEVTFQSWYGVPQSRIEGDKQGMLDYASRNYLTSKQTENLLNSNRTYNYYEYKNQTDNYRQNHYQLHWLQLSKKGWSFKNSSFITTGQGYFEEYKVDQDLNKYKLGPLIIINDTINNVNLIRQRWLNNHFFGNFSTLYYQFKNSSFELNNGLTQYNGEHYGLVNWMNYSKMFPNNHQYYYSESKKKEWNSHLKYQTIYRSKLMLIAELQNRMIDYTSKGDDNDLTNINIDEQFHFINPKLGVLYYPNYNWSFYTNISKTSREPVRTDFIDNKFNEIPKPEEMVDIEAGFNGMFKKWKILFNFYRMQYKNQLILTGELNDVGNALRRNVAKSFRTGIELNLVKFLLNNRLKVDFNACVSQNKMFNFYDYVYNYDDSKYQSEFYKQTDLPMSPNLMSGVGLEYTIQKKHLILVNFKYVGVQYLDNLSSDKSKINPFITSQLVYKYSTKFNGMKQFDLNFGVNNLLNQLYVNNGYNFKYISAGVKVTENFYYPQATLNGFLSIDFKF